MQERSTVYKYIFYKVVNFGRFLTSVNKGFHAKAQSQIQKPPFQYGGAAFSIKRRHCEARDIFPGWRI